MAKGTIDMTAYRPALYQPATRSNEPAEQAPRRPLPSLDWGDTSRTHCIDCGKPFDNGVKTTRLRCLGCSAKAKRIATEKWRASAATT